MWNKQNNKKKTFVLSESFFSVILWFSGGKCLTFSLNRFDLALLMTNFLFRGGLEETEIHCNRDSQSFCQAKLLFISSKALRRGWRWGVSSRCFIPPRGSCPSPDHWLEHFQIRLGFHYCPILKCGIQTKLLLAFVMDSQSITESMDSQSHIPRFFYLMKNGKTLKKEAITFCFSSPQYVLSTKLNSLSIRVNQNSEAGIA